MNINELYNIAAKGDTAAKEKLFKIIYERFLLIVRLKIRNKMECEEIVQEALLTISKKYDSLNIEFSFSAWSQEVLRNKIMNYFRSKYRHEKRITANEIEDQSIGVSNPNPMLKRKLIECLKKIGKVNIRQARILNLHYQGFSTEKICETLNINRNNLYIILSRARSLLKECINKEEI